MKNLGLLIIGILFTQLSFGQLTFDIKDTLKGDTSQLILSGYVDAYYSYNINNPGSAGNWGTPATGRIFDGEHNQISFNMIQTKLEYNRKRLSIVTDLLFGPAADLANYGNSGTALAIKQAYLSYDITKKLSFTVGQFGTHIGYELIDSPDNFNYSLSYLFGNGPFYHTGAKLDYAISDKIGIMAGILNGWDNMIDNNKAKSFAGQVSITPNDNIEIYVNWIGGNEESSDITGDSIKSFKQMVDLTASFALTDKLNLGVNAAFGAYSFDSLEVENWGGAALYLDYSITDHFALGARVEIFDDVSGVQYLGASYQGYTLTGIIKCANDHLYIKPEVRFDKSNSEIYFKGDGLSDNQLTLGIGVIGKF